VYVIPVDGSAPGLSLTPETPWSDERNPQWSPDGLRLVFETNRDWWEGQAFPTDEIYVMDGDGSDLVRLTSDPGFDVEPNWSPDGLQVVFSSSRGGAYDLFVVDVPPVPEGVEAADAPTVTQLTYGVEASNPAWEPDVAPEPVYLLEVGRGGPGRGGVRSLTDGIRCGADCAESYAAGTVVSLEAVPKAGSVFAGWHGACAGNAPICEITLDGDQRVRAIFALIGP
jgi:hypothetical protein